MGENVTVQSKSSFGKGQNMAKGIWDNLLMVSELISGRYRTGSCVFEFPLTFFPQYRIASIIKRWFFFKREVQEILAMLKNKLDLLYISKLQAPEITEFKMLLLKCSLQKLLILRLESKHWSYWVTAWNEMNYVVGWITDPNFSFL